GVARDTDLRMDLLLRLRRGGAEPILRLDGTLATAAPGLLLLRRFALLEERRELGDLTHRLLREPAPGEAIVALDEVPLDRALKLAERREDERSTVPRGDVPEVLAEVAVAPTDLELVPAVGALHGRSAPAHERVVELVLGVAPLALNVHRRGS